jgi:hypothetical protein
MAERKSAIGNLQSKQGKPYHTEGGKPQATLKAFTNFLSFSVIQRIVSLCQRRDDPRTNTKRMVNSL